MGWQRPKIEEPFARIDSVQAKQLVDEGKVEVIDVREPAEWASGHIPGAHHIPLQTFLNHPRETLPDAEGYVFVCAAGVRSAVAAEMAASIGRDNLYNLEGGVPGWAQKGYPIER